MAKLYRQRSEQERGKAYAGHESAVVFKAKGSRKTAVTVEVTVMEFVGLPDKPRAIVRLEPNPVCSAATVVFPINRFKFKRDPTPMEETEPVPGESTQLDVLKYHARKCNVNVEVALDIPAINRAFEKASQEHTEHFDACPRVPHDATVVEVRETLERYAGERAGPNGL